MRSLVTVLGATLACTLLFAPACHAADPRIEAILKDWRDRRKGIDAVQYVAKGKRMFPKGSFSDEPDSPPGVVLPTEDLWGKSNAEWAFDFQSGRFRFVSDLDVFNSKTGGMSPRWSSTMFDGKECVRYTPKTRNPHFKSPNQPELATDPWNFFGYPQQIIMAAHGLFPFGPDPKPKDLFQLDPKVYEINVIAEEKIGGRPVTVLRFAHPAQQTIAYDVSVDVERQSAILNLAIVTGGRTFIETRVDVDEFEGRWLPKRMEMSTYTTDGPVRKLDYEEFDIIERKLNLKSYVEDFQAPKKPNTVIFDGKEKKLRRIDADGKSLIPLEPRRSGT